MVEVTQEDRDAALLYFLQDETPDSLALILARHRIAATAAENARWVALQRGLVEALHSTTMEMERIAHTKATDFGMVHRLIVENRAALSAITALASPVDMAGYAEFKGEE